MDCSSKHIGRRVIATSLLVLGFSVLLARADFFVSDANNDVVDHFDSLGAFVNSSSIIGPTGLAVGPDGNLYVATPYDDGLGNGSSIVTFNPATGAHISTFTSHVSDNSLNNPGGIAFDASGNLYVGDLQGKILVYSSSGGAHVNELTDVNLNAPSGLAFGPSGTLYAADENSGNVLAYNAGAFSIVNTTGARMNIPSSVGVGLDGNLYVLDLSGTTGGIYQLNPTTGFASEIVNYSTSFFTANDLAVGPDGKLYVSGEDGNTGDGQVLQYGLDGSGGSVYEDLGSGSDPTYMTFATVPEPSALALVSMAGLAIMAFSIRRKISPAKQLAPGLVKNSRPVAKFTD